MSTITESEAREMESGDELDRICAEWMGWERGSDPSEPQWQWVKREPNGDWHKSTCCPKFSTDWAAAGPLLDVLMWNHEAGLFWNHISEMFVVEFDWCCGRQKADAETPQLAIARACAVLVSRGIERGDL